MAYVHVQESDLASYSPVEVVDWSRFRQYLVLAAGAGPEGLVCPQNVVARDLKLNCICDVVVRAGRHDFTRRVSVIRSIFHGQAFGVSPQHSNTSSTPRPMNQTRRTSAMSPPVYPILSTEDEPAAACP
jgi:hypothetical protein